MHRFVAILLLLLVPVRVFGAEALGVRMLEPGSQAEAMASMPDDCPMKHSKAPAREHPGGGGADCSGCQLCMTLAGPDQPVPGLSGVASSVAPVLPRVRFRSVDPRPTLRPPIA